MQLSNLYYDWFIQNKRNLSLVNSKLSSILKLKKNTIKPGSNKDLPYLPIDVIPMNSLAITEVRPNEEAQSSLIKIDKDDIVIGAMRVYFHRVIISPFEAITRSTCFVLEPYNSDYLSFALLSCNLNSSIQYAQQTSKGSTMPYAIWDGGLGDMIISIPTPEDAKSFNEIALPMIRQIQKSYFENKALKELRDSLLPKLMSGEIEVTNINLDV